MQKRERGAVLSCSLYVVYARSVAVEVSCSLFFVDTQAHHGWYRLALCACLWERQTLYCSRLFHERGIQFRRDSTNDLTIITRETRVGCCSRRGTPEVLRSVEQPRGVVLREDGATTSVSLGENDLVEELDGRVLGTSRLTLVDKFVEHLSFAHHGDVFGLFTRYTANELIHVKVIHHACFSAVA